MSFGSSQWSLWTSVDKIVVVVSMAGRGRGSDVPVETTFAQLWSIRSGKALSLRDYATRSDALEAVGLRE